MAKFLPVDQMAQVLEKWSATHLVYVPKKHAGLVRFGPWDAPGDLVLDLRLSQDAPKALFFPQSEELFRYDLQTQAVQVPPIGEQPAIVWGVHPCDVKSFLLLDKVFDHPDYQDPYYLKRRANTTLVALACNQPLQTCFCTTLGGGPHSSAGSDVLAVRLEHGYLLQAHSDKGQQLLDTLQDYPAATAEQQEQARVLAEQAQARLRPAFELSGLVDLLQDAFDHPVWNELHAKCLGCGTCTYLCPTCHCFDIVDETQHEQGKRVKNWDSCMFPLFTYHTSGHNPRPTQKERVRQRVLHKFRYFMENFQDTACVGCGRCVINCPVNLDIRQVIRHLREALATTK